MDKLATKDEVIHEDFELDDKAVDVLVDKTAKAVLPAIEDSVKSTVEGAMKDAGQKMLDEHLKNTEEIERKAVEAAQANIVEADPIAKGLADGKLKQEYVDMTPQMRFFRQMKALVDEDTTTLRDINRVALATQLKARNESTGKDNVAKVGYGNEATAADGGVLVPDADFITTVYDNLPKYGVSLREADVRTTDRTSVRVISLDSGLTFYSTAEAGVKTAAKLTFSKNEVSLQKYAVIVPATDELTQDAAIDFWNLVTRELSRAYGFVADTITFTDTTYGITNLSGVITQAVSGAGTTLLWDDLLKAEGKLEDDLDESNHKWYMRKETWYRLLQLKGTTNDSYLYGSLADGWIPNPNAPTTPWGREVVFVRVLPTSGASAGSPGVVGSNDAFAVFGDMKNYILFQKNGMQIKMLTEATIVDQASVSTNLATQDISAMRAVVRLLGQCPKGNRSKFVILGTGTVS